MAAFVEAARFLEIPARGKVLASPLQFLDHVARGLPASSVSRIANAIAPTDSEFRYRIVPKATLARKQAERRLSKSQSEIVARLVEVWISAVRVWINAEEARDFLTRAHPLLKNEPPISVALSSEMGAQLVREILGRLEHGTAV
ncbi:MAG: DUF2384 domain-containing protein [Alphaproteobacteria bacterium]|nr:DUF2384 domain-containing protein [Alphaproteobacteria bacterium]